MIVKWNEARVKIIPSQNGKLITLLPGHNEVNGKDWKAAREMVEADIKSGRITEVEPVLEEVPVKDDKGKETPAKKTVIKSAKAFKDLEPEEALKIVAETYSLETLEAWRKAERRDELRAALAEQIEKVNKAGTQAGK